MSDDESGFAAVMGGKLKLKGAGLPTKTDKKKRKKKRKKEAKKAAKKRLRGEEEGDECVS